MARARPQRRTTKTPPMFWTLNGWAWRTSVKVIVIWSPGEIQIGIEGERKKSRSLIMWLGLTPWSPCSCLVWCTRPPCSSTTCCTASEHQQCQHFSIRCSWVAVKVALSLIWMSNMLIFTWIVPFSCSSRMARERGSLHLLPWTKVSWAGSVQEIDKTI